MLAPIEALALVSLGWLGLPYAVGTQSGVVFLAGAVVLAAWAAQALQAERLARRRRAPYVADEPGAGVELLWLAPVVVVAATAFWSLAGIGSSADDVVAAYVSAWRGGRADEAVALFAVPPDPPGLRVVWDRQGARLSNVTITAAAEAGPDGGIDPDDPWSSVQWQEGAAVPGTAAAPSPSGSTPSPGRRSISGVIVREQPERGTFFGLVPTRTVRLVPVESIGTIALRTVELAPPIDGAPPVVVWRIASVAVLGEEVGG